MNYNKKITKKKKKKENHSQAKQYEKGIVTLILWDVLNNEIVYVERIRQCFVDQGNSVNCS